MKFEVNSAFLDQLKKTDIFQQRAGMRQGVFPVYKNRLNIGDVIHFHPAALLEQYSIQAHGKVLFSSGAFSSSASSLPLGSTVGRYCSIAPGLKEQGFRHPIEAVTLNSASFNFNVIHVRAYLDAYQAKNSVTLDPVPVKTPQPHKASITIGHDVWIGADVTIKGGVNIGNGAVVASNSLVTKDVDAYSMVGGTPAKVIKKRFSDEVAAGLEESKWWTYELGDMFREGLDLSSPEAFLEKFQTVKTSLSPITVKTFSPLAFIETGNGITNFSDNEMKHAGLVSWLGKHLHIDLKSMSFYQEKFSNKNSGTKLYVDTGKNTLRTKDGLHVCHDSNGKFFLSKDTANSLLLEAAKLPRSYFIKSPLRGQYLSVQKNGSLKLTSKKSDKEVFTWF